MGALGLEQIRGMDAKTEALDQVQPLRPALGLPQMAAQTRVGLGGVHQLEQLIA
jgi:hypothetical protein